MAERKTASFGAVVDSFEKRRGLEQAVIAAAVDLDKWTRVSLEGMTTGQWEDERDTRIRVLRKAVEHMEDDGKHDTATAENFHSIYGGTEAQDV